MKPLTGGLFPGLIPGGNQQRKNDEMTSEIIPELLREDPEVNGDLNQVVNPEGDRKE